MPQNDNIVNRSDEVQEIIGKSPLWLLRSGQTALLLFVLLLLVGSWLFHYPDIIDARIAVYTENPPAHIVARTTARIDRLLVDDNDTVRRGDVIAILENAASFDDVLVVKKTLADIDRFFISFDTIHYVVLSPDYQLGDIQSDYSSFLRLYNNYIGFMRLGYYPQKVKSLEEQVRMQRIYYDRLWSQRQILENEYHIALEQFRRDSVLYRKDVLSLVDFKASESTMLQKKYSFSGVRTDLAETQKDIIELEQDVVEAEKEFADQKQKLQGEIIESYNNFKSRMGYWYKAFVLETPIEGRVTFTNYWSMNQQVKTDEVVFTVVPFSESKIVGRVSLPLKGAGKVKSGQRVNIRFDNFPYMEFGMVTGRVKSISLVPSNDTYIAEIELPQNLETNYQIPLVFSQEMKGDAEIVTEDLRLIQRFMNPIKSLLRSKIMD
ncbi:HlyD family secretion protein [Mangrovibacterium sp.]|uniref:HlyD family secretion protein n=1 Tax=Mangrovibacterium sp. TaxID=1961364 RepID=UPI00356451DA